MKERRIEYYDSMSGDSSQFTSIIRNYIHDEWTSHRYKNGDRQEQVPQSGADSWQIENVSDGVPQQLNGYDCGVFAILFANYLSINKKKGVQSIRHRHTAANTSFGNTGKMENQL